MKILYFYPENPLLGNQGNNSRAIAMLNFFKKNNFKVDFVGEESKKFKPYDVIKLKELKLIDNGFLLNEYIRKKNPISFFLYSSLPNKIGLKIKDFDRLRFNQINRFNEIIKSNEYDFIIISYAYWANLVINNTNIDRNKTKLIIDTHDFLTAHFKKSKYFNIGKYFEKEITIAKYFDFIITISIEEKYIFSQFIEEKKVIYASHGLKSNFETYQKKYDIVYVASDNEHNRFGINWFFENVYTLLPKEFQICIIGKINNFMDLGKYSNVTQIEFVEVIDEIYKKSKIAICPIFSGTGIKIKVLEALSYGIPVVCNQQGVVGLVNKSNNGCLVTNDAEEFSTNLIDLIHNDSFYIQISNLAKNFFSNNYDENIVYRDLTKILRKEI